MPDINQIEKRWGSVSINTKEMSLPALKIQRVLSAMPKGDKLRILDFGCGEGKLILTLQQFYPEAEFYGSDVQTPIAVSNFKFFKLNNTEDDQAILPRDFFDVIISLDVLEHVDDLAFSLELIHTSLKRQGRFISFIPTEGNQYSFYQFYRWIFGDDLYVKTKDHHQAYSRKYLKSAITRKFSISGVSYSYHILGGFLDASFFALQIFKPIKKWWWKDNPYYHKDKKIGTFGCLMKIANGLCYLESSLAKNIALFSNGVHIVSEKVDN